MYRSRSLRVRADGDRAGFTLIELLIVIAIIAILVGLVTMGVMAVLWKGPDGADIAEIKKLEEALNNFKAKHGVYPPDYVKLCHYAKDYDTSNPLDVFSLQIITKIWPKIFNDPSMPGGVPWAGCDMNYVTKQLPQHPVTGQRCVILQGDQCLVFFLGGPMVQNADGRIGQSGFIDSAVYPLHNVNHPLFTQAGAQQSSVKFWYEFPAARLKARVIQTVPTNNLMPFLPPSQPTSAPPVAGADEFPSYADNYDLKRPFVYFVANKIPTSISGTPLVDATYNPFLRKGGFTSGIAELDGVQPYFAALDAKGLPKDYHYPDTVQIITAGKDRKFGALGGPWSAGEYKGAPPPPDLLWKDNRANFHGPVLGVRP